MWLLAIEIIAAIVAAARGWGWIPFGIVGVSFAIGLLGGVLFGYDSIGFLQVLDYGVVTGIVIMAIAGKKKPMEYPSGNNIATASNNRIKCPRCAEMIMPDAKICRYCGYKLVEE